MLVLSWTLRVTAVLTRVSHERMCFQRFEAAHLWFGTTLLCCVVYQLQHSCNF